MSDAFVSKWNARYAWSGDAVPPPAEVLSRFANRLPEGGIALDLACGRGGSAEWLGARGFKVSAWDSSEAAIEAIRLRPGSHVDTAEVRNVIERPPLAASFDVIVVSRFLERAVCPAIEAALRPAGVLFYQTFTQGLSNPDFLLCPNELLALFPTLSICHYRETNPDESGKAEAMLVGQHP